MFKWHVNAATGKGRPLAQDFTKVANGIAASLREFHISASRAEEDERDRPQLIRRTMPRSRAERSEQVGREIQGLSLKAAMTPSERHLDLSSDAQPSTPPPAKLITRVVVERSGRNYVPGSARRGIGVSGRGYGGGASAARGGRGGAPGAGGRGGRARGGARARAAVRRKRVVPERPLTDGNGRVLQEAPLKAMLERSRKAPVELECFEPSGNADVGDDVRDGGRHAISKIIALTVPRPVDRGDPNKLAERLLAGEVLRFHDRNQKRQVVNIAKRMALAKRDDKLVMKHEAKPSKDEMAAERRIRSSVRRMRDAQVKLVEGKYNTEVFEAQQKLDLPALEGLTRGLALNGTYRAGDEAAVMKKIRELLPVQRMGQESLQARM